LYPGGIPEGKAWDRWEKSLEQARACGCAPEPVDNFDADRVPALALPCTCPDAAEAEPDFPTFNGVPGLPLPFSGLSDGEPELTVNKDGVPVLSLPSTLPKCGKRRR